MSGILVRGMEFVECEFSPACAGEYDFAHDVSLIDFNQREAGHEPPDSPKRWMAMLPGGVGLGSTADEAVESALRNQRENIADAESGYWK